MSLIDDLCVENCRMAIFYTLYIRAVLWSGDFLERHQRPEGSWQPQ